MATKTEILIDDLRAQILSGALAPGALIDKAGLMAAHDISRQPVAVALDRLAFEGLVEVKAQHGSFVAPLDMAKVADWSLVRLAIEIEFTRRAAIDPSAAFMDDLARVLRYQRAAFAAGDRLGFYEQDVALHALIAAQTPSGEAHAVLERATAHLARMRRVLLPVSGSMASTLAQHCTIVDAISQCDPNAAMGAMRAHLTSVSDQLAQLAAQEPGA